jgi:hypothetical protein
VKVRHAAPQRGRRKAFQRVTWHSFGLHGSTCAGLCTPCESNGRARPGHPLTSFHIRWMRRGAWGRRSSPEAASRSRGPASVAGRARPATRARWVWNVRSSRRRSRPVRAHDAVSEEREQCGPWKSLSSRRGACPARDSRRRAIQPG